MRSGASAMFSTRAVVRTLGFCAAVTTHACAQHRGGYDSLYTDLSGADCHSEKEDKETGASVERCPGIAGYALLVQNDDDRASVTVVSPDGTQHPLDYWNV